MGTKPALLRGQKRRQCWPLETPTVERPLTMPTFLSKLLPPTRGAVIHTLKEQKPNESGWQLLVTTSLFDHHTLDFVARPSKFAEVSSHQLPWLEGSRLGEAQPKG